MIVGGIASNSYVGSIEAYDESLAIFREAGQLITPRAGHTATALRNGKILICGGVTAAATVLDSAELYSLEPVVPRHRSARH